MGAIFTNRIPKLILRLLICFILTGAFITYGKLSAKAASGPICYIDTPKYNQGISNSDVSISGWGLNSSGISRVDVYIDGSFRTTATSVSRPDVAAVFASYSFSNAANGGFTCTISKGTLSAGRHEAEIAFIGNNGSVQWTSVAFYENKPAPVSFFDSPSNNVSLSNSDLTLAGWALNSSGISRADVYIDGSFRTSITSFYGRPDVAAAFSGYNYPNASNSGFSCTISKSSFSAGYHEAEVAFIGNDGSVEWRIIKFSENRPDSLSCIDLPSNGQTFNNGDITVAGWALNGAGVARVDVYLDHGFRNSITSFYNRPDVATAFGGRGFDNINSSGFSYTLPSNYIYPGSHELEIAVIGNDGAVQWYVKSFSENKASPKMCIDPIDQDQPFNGTHDITVNGWALNASTVGRVDLVLDGNTIARTWTLNADGTVKAQEDPNNQYGNNCRFSFTVSKDAIPNLGNHTFSVYAYGLDGTLQIASRTIASVNIESSAPFNISLSTLASKNGVSASSINPNSLKYSQAGLYQFLSLNYIDVSVDNMNKILSGCGNLNGKGAQFLAAAQKYNINPIYFAVHSRIESGNGGNAPSAYLARGINVNAGTYYLHLKHPDGSLYYGTTPYTVATSATYYNLFGIYAYDCDPSYDGSIYAGSQGWSSVDAAIDGAAKWIYQHYIHGQEDHGGYNQNTLYEMKWDPQGWSKNDPYEYATDTDWAQNIASMIANYSYMYNNQRLTFYIPSFT